MARATLIFVDDHPLFVQGFVHMVRGLRPDWTMHTATSARDALRVLSPLFPDVAVVDIGLPDDDGFGLLRSIAEFRPSLPVVLISGRDDTRVRVRAKASGARGFIAKTVEPTALASRIDAVLRGECAFTEDEPSPEVVKLTTRQTQVLGLISEGHANKEIRHRLGIAERTVRLHITEVYRLLGANSRTQAMIRARELGLIG